MLKEKNLSIDDLLLDPNNPRFIEDLGSHKHIGDDRLEAAQEATLKRFANTSGAGENGEEDPTDISDLVASMRQIGYVPIDRIVVRSIAGSGKFLVIEGNRRVCTIKKLLREYETVTEPSKKHQLESHLEGFKQVPCLMLETEGLSEEAVEHRVRVILGLRHHGSLLEWEPLPKAFNVFSEYMQHDPPITDFVNENRRIKDVQSRLSIPRSKVISSLKTYVVFRQLREHFPEMIRDDHYSLIEAAVGNRNLVGSYFRMDLNNFLLDEPSVQKMADICQFDVRKTLPTDHLKKIISKPQDFSKLGRLVQKAEGADHEATREYVRNLIKRVENPEDLDMALEMALSDLTNYETRKNWTRAVGALLDQQEEKLPVSDYSGTGNDRGNKDALKERLATLRRLL
jgi:hypothetical protein